MVLNSIKEDDFHCALEAWKKLWDHSTSYTFSKRIAEVKPAFLS
jgi:hypothetical protein